MIQATWPGMLLIAGVIGGILAWFATRAQRTATRDAQARTIEVLEQTIKAQESLAEQLNSSANEQLKAMTSERDAYRADKHTLANDLQAERLKSKELEMRPDVSTIYNLEKEWHAQREKFYEKMFSTQQAMHQSQETMLQLIGKLDKRIDTEMTAFAKAMERLVERLDTKLPNQ